MRVLLANREKLCYLYSRVSFIAYYRCARIRAIHVHVSCIDSYHLLIILFVEAVVAYLIFTNFVANVTTIVRLIERKRIVSSHEQRLAYFVTREWNGIAFARTRVYRSIFFPRLSRVLRGSFIRVERVVSIKRAIGHVIRLSFLPKTEGEAGRPSSRGWVDVRKTTPVQFSHPSVPRVFFHPLSPLRTTGSQSTRGLPGKRNSEVKWPCWIPFILLCIFSSPRLVSSFPPRNLNDRRLSLSPVFHPRIRESGCDESLSLNFQRKVTA